MARRVSFRILAAALLTVASWVGGPALAQGDAAVMQAAPGASEPAPAQRAEMARMQAELQQQRELVLLMRHRMAEADSARAWLPWLGLGLAVSTSLALWLGVRLLRGRRRTDPPHEGPSSHADAMAFAVAAAAAKAGDGSLASDAGRLAAARGDLAADASGAARRGAGPGDGFAERPGGSRAVSPAAATTAAGALGASESESSTHTRPAVAMPRTAEPSLLASELSLSGQPPRAVTVEELLDLEQQVDFFMVLGQEDSAIDLLVSHIRSTGGTSALPYLKLLEVYREQGNAEGYERTRSRFNQRFNAYAPDWSADPEAGRVLDDYPGVLERLQRVWPSPHEGMAELESLLFRRHEGELFDLPAYRELLLLYAVARDLFEQAPVTGAPVDLLLPLDDEPQDTTSPRPHLGLFSDDGHDSRTANWARMNERPAARAQHHAADRTVTLRTPELPPPRLDLDMALDIDLSEFSPAPREFTQPAAFNDVDLSRSDFASFDDPPVPPRRG